MSKPCVWIDATNSNSGIIVWGMTIVERQIREFSLLGIESFKVFLCDDELHRIGQLREDFSRLYAVEITWVRVPNIQDFWTAVGEANESLIIVSGDTIYDDRVISHVLKDGPGVIICTENRAACYINAGLCATLSHSTSNSWELLTEKLCFRSVLRPRDLDQYIPSLRLKMPAFISPVSNEDSVQTIENRMFHRSFKGAIDFVARYGYYHLVRWLTRCVINTGTRPNTYTIMSILCVWMASPFIWAGWIGTGLILAWLGVILDSLDGKLARLRLHLSDSMGKFEHFAAAPGLALWLLSVGWYLSDGKFSTGSPETFTTISLISLFVLDKICSGLFRHYAGKELFDYERIDAIFHLFAARRNIALVTFSIGALCGCLAQSFTLFLGLMSVTFVVHVSRAGWILKKKIIG